MFVNNILIFSFFTQYSVPVIINIIVVFVLYGLVIMHNIVLSTSHKYIFGYIAILIIFYY